MWLLWLRWSWFVGELIRITAGTYEQALIHGNNAYAVADWYHEAGCQYALLPSQVTTNNFDGITHIIHL